MTKWSVTALVTLVLFGAGDVSPARAQSDQTGPPVTADLAELTRYLEREGRPAADYVLSKFEHHDVVVLGESHWVQHDVELVLDLISHLRDEDVHLLAVELLPGWRQETVDRLTTEGESFDRGATMDLMRGMAWPYEEYAEILAAVWDVNQALPAGSRPLRVRAIGPRIEARDSLLAEGLNFDTYMADRVLEGLERHGGRALVYTGAHHAFTRFLQPELPRRAEDRVHRFMERMGNVLWRHLGERVFRIELHRPWRCRQGDGSWEYCLPVGGLLDCAASPLRRPVGFDVVGSPFAELDLDPSAYYAFGHPSPRLVDFTDGYVWTQPVSGYRSVTLVPLEEFAPDSAALREVAADNPFVDDHVPVDSLPAQWNRQRTLRADYPSHRGWETREGWRKTCEVGSGGRR